MDPTPKQTYRSICKSKTFLPPSADLFYLAAQLLRNLESACIKARRYGLVAKRLLLYLRRHDDFGHTALEATLSRPTVATLELAPIARKLLHDLIQPGLLYRATGVVLEGLQRAGAMQFGLFDDPTRILKVENASAAIDGINEEFGKHTIHVGESLSLKGRPRGKNEILPSRRQSLLEGEGPRRHINLPVLAVKV